MSPISELSSGLVQLPFDPSILKIGEIYEVKESLYQAGKEPVFLGILTYYNDNSLEFKSIAARDRYYVHGVSRPIRYFRFVSHVPRGDLPLYINWMWKSDEFSHILQGATPISEMVPRLAPCSCSTMPRTE